MNAMDKGLFDGLGHPISRLESGIRYRMVDHGYYTTALKPGEVDSIRPVIPREEKRYIAMRLSLKRTK